MRDALGTVQSVLVLGGGSEIARATIEKMIAAGTTTVILGVREPGDYVDTAEELRGLGATNVEVVAFDALDPASHVVMINDVFDHHNDIDVVIQAFGVLGDQADFEADPVRAATAVSINFSGAVSSGLAAAHRLRSQGHGTLVVLSSVAGERARKSNFVYGSSKAGLDAFAQGLSDALVGSGADVLIVRPGFVHSKMTAGMDPAPFATTPDAVADVIIDGIAKRRRIVWAPAPLRWVFSGMRHLPVPVWRKVSAKA